MIGLPKATAKSDYETAVKALSMEPDVVRIYPTLVIKILRWRRCFNWRVYPSNYGGSYI